MNRTIHISCIASILVFVSSSCVLAQPAQPSATWDEEFHQLSSQLAEDPYDLGSRAVVQLLGQACETLEGAGHSRFYVIDAHAAYRTGDLDAARTQWRHLASNPESAGWAAYGALWLLETSDGIEDAVVAQDAWTGLVLEDAASADSDVVVELAKRLAYLKHRSNDPAGADALLAQAQSLTLGGRGFSTSQRRELLLSRALMLRTASSPTSGVSIYEELVALDEGASGTAESLATTSLELARRRAAVEGRELGTSELWQLITHPKLQADPNAAYIACELSFVANGRVNPSELQRLADWTLSNYASWQTRWADPSTDHDSSKEDVRVLVHNLVVRGERSLRVDVFQQLQNIRLALGDPAGM